MGMRHMDRGAFVPDINDADAMLRNVVPDRLNMAALKAEDPIDASRL